MRSSVHTAGAVDMHPWEEKRISLVLTAAASVQYGEKILGQKT
jgi:hypothetical protein